MWITSRKRDISVANWHLFDDVRDTKLYMLMNHTSNFDIVSGERAVLKPTDSLPHSAFFAELASLEQSDPSWCSVSAGLVTLRLVDAWMTEGAAAVRADGWGLRSVAAAIEEMPKGMPARTILQGVVDALRESVGDDLCAVAPRLMAYARCLDLDARWALASDVYLSVIAHAHPVEESDVAIAAHLRLAYCERSLGALDDAAASYATASAIATDVDDMFGILRAEIGAAKIAMERGNLPRAETLLDDVIVRARTRDELSDVHAMALQDRAGVAFYRERYDLAVQLAYQSLELTRNPTDRDRLLSDIALAFTRLGVRSAARDAFLIVEATAQEQYQRWTATMNLMEIAARDGAMPVFERYRRSLMAVPFPPPMRAQYHLQAAEGYEALDMPTGAASEARCARDIAREFGYHKIAFDAEALLGRAERGQLTAARSTEMQAADAVMVIAGRIGEMRRRVPG